VATQPKPTQTKPTLVKADQQVTDTPQHPNPRPVPDTADTTTEQAHATAMTTQPAQELMIQLARHGLNFSLKSLQVWADLARQLGPTPLGFTAGATMVSLAYDGFENLLASQREIVDQLHTIQRQLAQQFLDTTTQERPTHPH